MAKLRSCPDWFRLGALGDCSSLQLLFVAVFGALISIGLVSIEPAIADAPRSKSQSSQRLTQNQLSALKPGDAFQECSDCPHMVVIPSGTFMMGSNKGNRDERPVHDVTIGRAFAAGKFEVTVAEYEACVKDGACRDPQWRRLGSYYNIETGSNDHYKRMGAALTGLRHPIVGVSWINAKQYIDWINGKLGGTSYRLLTEAEWEYLARAGEGQRTYWWGNRFRPLYANSGINSWRDQWAFSAPVGSFVENPFGLYDLHGNVWEWVEDCHTPSYLNAPNNGAAKIIKDCNRRIVRGGSWYYAPRLLRSADRYALSFVKRRNDTGFRVGRTLSLRD